MKRIFPLPIYSLIRICAKNGGVTLRGLKNLPPWILKTLLFEPIRWVELTKNKKVDRHKIEKDPIFILGFYRSGTSFTHQFLSQDERLGFHTTYQMIFPEVMLTTEKGFSRFLNFICRVFKIQDPIHRVPMDFNYPGEEDGTMTTAINPRGAQWGFFFPKRMDEYLRKYVLFDGVSDEELGKWKDDMHFLYKKISMANNGKQLILKSPPNTARIKVLLSMYPNAKFIFIHRDPFDVYSSNKRFRKVTNRIYAMGSRDVDMNQQILEMYSKTMERYLQEKDLIPNGQLIEVAYDEMMRNPMEIMEKVYNTLHLPDFAQTEEKMKSYISSQRDFVPLKHELPLDEKTAVEQWLNPYIDY